MNKLQGVLVCSLSKWSVMAAYVGFFLLAAFLQVTGENFKPERTRL